MPFGDQIQEPGGLGRFPRVRCGGRPDRGGAAAGGDRALRQHPGAEPGQGGGEGQGQAQQPEDQAAGNGQRGGRVGGQGGAEVLVAEGEGLGADDADEGVAGQDVGDGGKGPDGQVPPAGSGAGRGERGAVPGQQPARDEHDALVGEFLRPVFRGERIGLIRQQDYFGRGRPDLPHLDTGVAPRARAEHVDQAQPRTKIRQCIRPRYCQPRYHHRRQTSRSAACAPFWNPQNPPSYVPSA